MSGKGGVCQLAVVIGTPNALAALKTCSLFSSRRIRGPGNCQPGELLLGVSEN